MTSRRRILGIGSAACLTAALVAAADPAPASLSATGRRIEQQHGFRVRFDLPPSSGLSGKPLAPEERVDALRRLETWGHAYPAGFLRRFLDEIVVVNDLVVDGIHARGRRDVRRVFLQYRRRKGRDEMRMRQREFDHEVFHALEGGLAEVDLPERWNDERSRALRLREMWDDYRISPSHAYTFSWERTNSKPWVAYVPIVNLLWMLVDDDDPPPGFANVIGTVAPREDRATVAAALLSGDEAFLRRAAADRELREKVAIVRAMYLAGSAGAIDHAYWSDLADGPIEVPALAELEERLWNGNGHRDAQPPVAEAAVREAAPPARDEPVPVRTRPLPSGGPPVAAVVDDPPPPKPRPEPTPTPAPQPAATPPVKPAPEPEPDGGDTSPAAMYARGVAAFEAGSLDRAESLWAHMLQNVDPGYGTVRIAINCDPANVAKTRSELGDAATFYALAYPFRGRACHLTMSGLYRTPEEASAAIAGLPASVRAQNPRPTSVGEVLGLIGR